MEKAKARKESLRISCQACGLGIAHLRAELMAIRSRCDVPSSELKKTDSGWRVETADCWMGE